MERRLAAILAADVVGYTRLMNADEVGTLRRLTNLRETVLEPLVTQYNGRIVKLVGDGLLVEFASAVDSVACAMDWQISVLKHEAKNKPAGLLKFRIGINLGDVIIENDDVHGEGVNIAARLEGLAEPGNICVSEDVYRQAKGKTDAHFVDAGLQKLKNLPDPVRIYNIVVEPSGDLFVSHTTASHSFVGDSSVAVLPFVNLSDPNGQEYLADGITEDIITTLSKISKLFVVSRGSILTYKEKAVDAHEAGRELGVSYALEGTLRNEGNRVRITAKLIEIETGRHLWARRFDREVVNVFETQDEITKEIVSALQVELTEGEQARLAAGSTRNIEAWQLAFEGRDLVHLHRKGSVRKGRKLIEQATDLDPEYVFAWGSLSEAHWKEAANEGWSDDPENSFKLALEASDRALTIDPENADVLSMRSIILVTMREFEEALELARQALRIAHSQTNAIALATITLRCCGLAEEGLRQLQLAKRYCKVYPAWYLYNEAFCHWILGQTEEAITALVGANDIDPNFSLSYALAAAIHAEAGNLLDAQSAAEKTLRADPLFSSTRFVGSRPFQDQVLDSNLRSALKKAGLPD